MNRKKYKLFISVIFLLFFSSMLSGCSDKKKTPKETAGGEKTCYLTISCAAVLDNMDSLAQGKEKLIPDDGFILPKSEAAFNEGESVLDVLKRTVSQNRIHLETSVTASLNTGYIEGIGNLYEFDCGAASGWLYRVNGQFLNIGISDCLAEENDDIEFVYTCDLGRDAGNEWTE